MISMFIKGKKLEFIKILQFKLGWLLNLINQNYLPLSTGIKYVRSYF